MSSKYNLYNWKKHVMFSNIKFLFLTNVQHNNIKNNKIINTIIYINKKTFF